MKNVVLLILGSLFGILHLQCQIINPNPLSKRITGYKMNVELHPETKTISGSMDAFWVNSSFDNVPDIQLHMYLNAFRSNKSTVFSEEGDSPGTKEIDFGWVSIKSITDKKGNDLKSVMKFISPDDNNPDDMTVLDVPLPEAARPGLIIL